MAPESVSVSYSGFMQLQYLKTELKMMVFICKAANPTASLPVSIM